MAVVKGAAVAVTVLMGLANLGQVLQPSTAAWKVLGLSLAAAALVAVVGFIARKSWGPTAFIALGAVNLVAAIIGAMTGLDGWPVGVVLSVLGIVLGTVYTPASHSAVAA